MLAMRAEGIRGVRKSTSDLRRFWHTHIIEPVRAIGTEFFHGYQPTIDPAQVRQARHLRRSPLIDGLRSPSMACVPHLHLAQVRQTRESLARMLQDFVRDTHAAAEGDAALRAALDKARAGSMEAVTAAYERQVGARP